MLTRPEAGKNRNRRRRIRKMSWDFEKHYINGEWTPSEDDAWIEV